MNAESDVPMRIVWFNRPGLIPDEPKEARVRTCVRAHTTGARPWGSRREGHGGQNQTADERVAGGGGGAAGGGERRLAAVAARAGGSRRRRRRVASPFPGDRGDGHQPVGHGDDDGGL